jgi:hypothetical protein
MPMLNDESRTFDLKVVMPVAWCVFIFLILALGLSLKLPVWLALPVAAVVSAGILYCAIKHMDSLADEIIDDGDALIVKNGTMQERILLDDIAYLNSCVHIGRFTRTQFTLILRRPSIFGDRIEFIRGDHPIDRIRERIRANRRERRTPPIAT